MVDADCSQDFYDKLLMETDGGFGLTRENVATILHLWKNFSSSNLNKEELDVIEAAVYSSKDDVNAMAVAMEKCTLKTFDRCLSWNTGSFEATGSYSKRSAVLTEMLKKHEPVIVKLNEIRGITEAALMSFAHSKGYDVLALTYSKEKKGKDTMEKAAGILVRRDSNIVIDNAPRFERTFATPNGSEYSIAGVFDRKYQIHHISLYVQHTERKNKEDRLRGALVEIKKNLLHFLKIEDEEALKSLKIIVSGDLNCDILTVESVCSDFAEEKKFVVLQDALYYKWYTRTEEWDETVRCTFTKIDYVLCSKNVSTMMKTHKPFMVEYDHYIILEDIYHQNHDFNHPFCKNSECDFKCKVGRIRPPMMSQQETHEMLDQLVVSFEEKDKEQYGNSPSICQYYRNFKSEICNRFPAPIPERFGFNTKKNKTLTTVLCQKVFRDESNKTTFANLSTNKLNFICATVACLEQDNINDDLSDGDVEEKGKLVMGKIRTTRNNARNSPAPQDSPASSRSTPIANQTPVSSRVKKTEKVEEDSEESSDNEGLRKSKD